MCVINCANVSAATVRAAPRLDTTPVLVHAPDPSADRVCMPRSSRYRASAVAMGRAPTGGLRRVTIVRKRVCRNGACGAANGHGAGSGSCPLFRGRSSMRASKFEVSDCRCGNVRVVPLHVRDELRERVCRDGACGAANGHGAGSGSCP